MEIEEIALAEDEPLTLDGLEQWQLKTDMFESRRRCTSDGRIEELMKARGRLPNGAPGGLVYDDAHADVLELDQELEAYKDALAATPQDIALDLGDYRLTGSVESVDTERNTVLFWRIGRIREKDRIGAWLQLLAWVAQEDVGAEAHLVCLAPGGVKQQTLRVGNGTDARRELRCWLDAWWRGIDRMLPFSPPASMIYAKALGHANGHQVAWQAATGSWRDERSYDELQNSYVSLAYDGDDPFPAEDFAELAEELLGPLLDAEE